MGAPKGYHPTGEGHVDFWAHCTLVDIVKHARTFDQWGRANFMPSLVLRRD